MSSCVVVFSGGQDSTTCLAQALKAYEKVYTIGFTYGQRHSVELECRARILEKIESITGTHVLQPDLLVDIRSFGQIATCALTTDAEIRQDEKTGLPTSFVPGRNLVFLTYAASYAWKVGAQDIITGVGEADFSGYPDCREATIRALEAAVNLGMETHFRIVTPLMHLSKQATWELAESVGGEALVDFIRTETHTCYEGVRAELHPWGYGCGKCPACVLRERGWNAYLAGKA